MFTVDLAQVPKVRLTEIQVGKKHTMTSDVESPY